LDERDIVPIALLEERRLAVDQRQVCENENPRRALSSKLPGANASMIKTTAYWPADFAR
jgi:hypothetical protein